MATVKLNPVLASISGAIGGMVFYTRYGKTISREWIIPPNPNTPAQQANRSRFRDAMASWRQLPDYEKDSYNRRAKNLGLTGHNLYISRYMKGTAGAERVQTVTVLAYKGDNDDGLFLDSSSPSPFRRGGRGVRSPSLHPAFRSVTAPSTDALFLPAGTLPPRMNRAERS